MGLESVTLHVGPQKTATTFIQQCLATLRPALKARGVALVNRGEMVGLENFPQWGAFLRSTPEGASQFQKELAELTERRLAGVAGKPTALLMSNESFVGVPQPEFSDWPRAEAALGQALEAIGVGPANLVFYTRRQDTWLESIYMQRIHAGRFYTFDNFLKTRAASPTIRYTSLLDRLSALPGVASVRVRPFEMIRGGGGRLLKDLLSQVGCADLASIASHIPATNASYSRPAWKAALAANRYAKGRGPEERTRIKEGLRDVFPLGAYKKPQLLGKKRRERLIEAYRSDNEELFARYMPDLPVDSYSSVAATSRLAELG